MGKKLNFSKIICYFTLCIFIVNIFTPFFGVISTVSAETDNWWNTAWLYRRSITINSSSVSNDQVDFPVLIDLVDSAFVYKVQSDGDDFVFVNADGVK
ncbi:MAG: hypothetical protein QXZ70_06355, partial [Candidatus Bathyarchaeia archaeon]